MYDVGDKLLNGIKTMHVNSTTCFEVKGGVSEAFLIDRGIRQGVIMSHVISLYIWMQR